MALNKDRQSRMAVSTVNQPPKKSGAGGSYTWGSTMDVTDYEPVGVQQANTVVLAAAPTPVVTPMGTTATQSLNFSIQDPSAFPTLGSPTAAPGVAVRSWGPATMAPAMASTGPAVVLNEASLRVGALDMVDAQHPRNQFAKKAYTKPATEVVVQAQPQVIDWSKAGMPPEVMQQVLKAANPAHLSPYAAKPAEPLPLEVLQARTAADKQKVFIAQQPAAQRVAYAPKPVVIKQPMQR